MAKGLLLLGSIQSSPVVFSRSARKSSNGLPVEPLLWRRTSSPVVYTPLRTPMVDDLVRPSALFLIDYTGSSVKELK